MSSSSSNLLHSAIKPAYLVNEGNVATITLNRPESYNAIDLDMAVRLRDLAVEVDRQHETKIVVIRGEGAAFCGGGDINHFVGNLDNIGPCIRELLSAYHEFLVRLRQMPKLVVSSVHGSAAGAGLSLASMSDLCIAADDTKFAPAYAKLGVSPDGGGTYGLARAVGARRALQIFLAEKSFSASQAAEWGLVSKLVPPQSLADATTDYTGRLSRISIDAIASTKRLLRNSPTALLEDHLTDEMESLIRCMQTDTFVSAVTSFVSRE